MRRGLYRIFGTDGRPNDVRVEDEGISVPVEEGVYRARGYQPPVNEFPLGGRLPASTNAHETVARTFEP